MAELSRREMLQICGAGLVGSAIAPASLSGLATSPDGLLGPISRLKPKGQSYEATVPDTIDLAQSANLSINALIGNLEPATFSGVYQGFNVFGQKPQVNSLTWNISPKNARTLPTLRVITGSDFGLEREYQLMSDLVSQINENGQMYYPFDGSGPPKGTSYPQTNANTVFALMNWYERDDNPQYQKWIALLSEGLKKATIVKEDRAYFPMQSGITKDGKWLFMLHEGTPPIAYTPPAEPESDQQGLEGAAKQDSARCMSALLRHYEATGDMEALDKGRRIGNFLMKSMLWDNTSSEGSSGREHGIFSGHSHNNTNCLMALLDLARVDNNDWLAEAVREGYHHQLRTGVVRMGWFPAWSQPEKYNRPLWLLQVTEPCSLGDTIALAVKLNDAGLGDYWDHVDSIIRNHLIEQQVSDLDLVTKCSKPENPEDRALLRRFLGSYATGGVTSFDPRGALSGCCTANSPQGLYYAWHGITRFDGSVATVNLFLNRPSAWMDIDSYLPYEGKVVLHNKEAKTVMIRIPGWAERDKIKVTAGKSASSVNVGSYIMVKGLKKGDKVQLDFPIRQRTDIHTIANRRYEVAYRASTVISVKPLDADNESSGYNFYRRQHYLADKAPMKQTTQFVAENLIPLGPF